MSIEKNQHAAVHSRYSILIARFVTLCLCGKSGERGKHGGGRAAAVLGMADSLQKERGRAGPESRRGFPLEAPHGLFP